MVSTLLSYIQACSSALASLRMPQPQAFGGRLERRGSTSSSRQNIQLQKSVFHLYNYITMPHILKNARQIGDTSAAHHQRGATCIGCDCRCGYCHNGS